MATYSAYTDQELVALLKGGDKSAFTAIYERYHSLLYVYAHKKLHHKQESQDVIPEVLIALWNKRIDFLLMFH